MVWAHRPITISPFVSFQAKQNTREIPAESDRWDHSFQIKTNGCILPFMLLSLPPRDRVLSLHLLACEFGHVIRFAQ